MTHYYNYNILFNPHERGKTYQYIENIILYRVSMYLGPLCYTKSVPGYVYDIVHQDVVIDVLMEGLN